MFLDEPDIILTQSALNFINDIITEKKIPRNLNFRIKAEGNIGGIFHYEMGFDPNFTESEINFIKGKINFVMDRTSYENMLGSTIDYIENENRKGFVFDNPKQKNKCGGCHCKSY